MRLGLWYPLAAVDPTIPEYVERFKAAFDDIGAAEDITYAHAANAIAVGEYAEAVAILEGLLSKIDGVSPPPDWMDESEPTKVNLRNAVELLIGLLL